MKGPRADFANKILDHYGQFYSNMFGEHSCTLHDPLAAAVALDSKLAGYRKMPLGVELTGTHTRGQVVSDLRSISSDAYISTNAGAGRVPVKVAESVDVPAFLDLMFASLKG